MTKHYIGEVGTVITLDTLTDISDATIQKIKYKKPSGDTGEWDANLVEAEATQLQYTLVEGDIDEAGTWLFQAYAETPTFSGLGETVEIEFFPTFS